MSHLSSKPSLIALACAGLCAASLFAVVVFALPPARETAPAEQAAPLPEVILPEAPLDAAALTELQERLGHKPFSGTVFESAKAAAAPAGPSPSLSSPSLLHAAHLLDEAAYVLEQEAIFSPAEAIRSQAADLRAQAKRVRAGGGDPPAENLPVAVEIAAP